MRVKLSECAASLCARVLNSISVSLVNALNLTLVAVLNSKLQETCSQMSLHT